MGVMVLYCSVTYLNNGAHDMTCTTCDNGYNTAHYFKSGKIHHMTLSTGPKPVGTTMSFKSKAEAKAWAASHNCKAWNY